MQLTADTTVRDLLHAHPHTAEVLLRHGMCASCQQDPPPVPLGHFAAKHCAGDLNGLIGELRGVLNPDAGV
jgi:hypothetical protein